MNPRPYVLPPPSSHSRPTNPLSLCDDQRICFLIFVDLAAVSGAYPRGKITLTPVDLRSHHHFVQWNVSRTMNASLSLSAVILRTGPTSLNPLLLLQELKHSQRHLCWQIENPGLAYNGRVRNDPSRSLRVEAQLIIPWLTQCFNKRIINENPGFRTTEFCDLDCYHCTS